MDLRLAAVKRYLESGDTYAETGKIFGVDSSSVRRRVQQYRKTGDLSDKPLNRGFKKIDPDKLRTYVKERQDDTQQEIADAFGCSSQAVSKALKRLNITRKKTRRCKERRREEVEAYEETLEDFPEEKRCYADESGFQQYYDREYGCAPRGEKVLGEVPGMRFARTNLVAAQIGGETVAPMYYEQAANSAVFEVRFERRLTPC